MFRILLMVAVSLTASATPVENAEVDATKLRTRNVATTAPLAGQVLAWNQSAVQWAPAPAVASGTWCGNSASRTRCLGHQPASSCPPGFTQDYVSGSNGEIFTFFCVKR